MIFLCIFALLFEHASTRHIHGYLNSKEKASLKEAFHIKDLGLRRLRLQKLSTMGPTPDDKLKTIHDLDQTMIVVNETRLANNSLNIVDVNEMSGVADYMFEGDISLTEQQLSQLERSLKSDRSKRQASLFTRKWTDGIVYYQFDASLSARKISSLKAAIADLSAKTCVKFVESSNAKNRVLMKNGPGCSSSVGMIGGVQILTYGEGCEHVGTASHELMHALGIFHEHSRPDRDYYLTIDHSKVPKSMGFNLFKIPELLTAQYTPYEYGSVMHYDASSFGEKEDDLIMVPKDKHFSTTIGSKFVSFYDYFNINAHYGCTVRCTSFKCQFGGVENPNNCGVCICPRGFGGALCDERPAGCGSELIATSSWQSFSSTLGNGGSLEIQDNYTECNHWIKSPSGTLIELKITNTTALCAFGCIVNGIEVKLDLHTQATGLRLCCLIQTTFTYRSTSNLLPIITYNSYNLFTTDMMYRFVEGNTTTTASPKTETTTTKSCPPDTSSKCKRWNDDYGFCKNEFYPIEERKRHCSTTCNLCS